MLLTYCTTFTNCICGVCSPSTCMLLNDEAEFNKLYYMYIGSSFYHLAYSIENLFG